MNDLKDAINKYHFHLLKVEYKGKIKILTTDKGKFVLKEKSLLRKPQIYQYLRSREFSYFMEPYNDLENDNFELSPYIEEVETPKEQKALDLIHLMTLLHNKTTFYKDEDAASFKETYEKTKEEIEYLKYYYMDLETLLLKEEFMAMASYHLFRNISKVFYALEIASRYLEKWYSVVKDKTKKRFVLSHNNLDISHYINSDKPYFISFDHAKVESPINDLYVFYKKSFKFIDFPLLFKIYLSKYPLFEEEKYLLYTLLLIPSKFSFTKKRYLDTVSCYYFISYIDKTLSFVLEEDKKSKKEEKN